MSAYDLSVEALSAEITRVKDKHCVACADPCPPACDSCGVSAFLSELRDAREWKLSFTPSWGD